MKFTKLATSEQLQQIKKDDVLVVKWCDYFVDDTPNVGKVMLYKVEMVQGQDEELEIVCKKKDNHYFNCSRYLKGLSFAEEVYLVEV